MYRITSNGVTRDYTYSEALHLLTTRYGNMYPNEDSGAKAVLKGMKQV